MDEQEVLSGFIGGKYFRYALQYTFWFTRALSQQRNRAIDTWIIDLIWIIFALLLVLANGFFVAAEFAMVKVRRNKLALMVRQGRPMAQTAQWLRKRLDNSLSACQLGITVASLGLGWIGEPAIARLLRPAFDALGISSTALQHGIAFTVAFLIITGAHLVIGEQAPKIYAIRRPDIMALWCALPLRWFYVVSYPDLPP
jgi:CBS domain containing-hemolysin-like protein